MRYLFPAVIITGLILMTFGLSRAKVRPPYVSPGPKTPEEASRLFMLEISPADGSTASPDWEAMNSLTSATGQRQLGLSNIRELMIEMSVQLRDERWVSKSKARSADTVVVDIAPREKERPVVCTRDGKEWCVDVFETWRRWKGLTENQAKQKFLLKTGVALTGAVVPNDKERAVCSARLKELSRGIMMYTQDYDERYPIAGRWDSSLQPYVPEGHVFQCPSAAEAKLPKTDKLRPVGFSLNKSLSTLHLGKVEQPWDLVQLYESSRSGPGTSGLGADLVNRHNKGANFSFSDGHVKWFPASQSQTFALHSSPE